MLPQGCLCRGVPDQKPTLQPVLTRPDVSVSKTHELNGRTSLRITSWRSANTCTTSTQVLRFEGGSAGHLDARGQVVILTESPACKAGSSSKTCSSGSLFSQEAPFKP